MKQATKCIQTATLISTDNDIGWPRSDEGHPEDPGFGSEIRTVSPWPLRSPGASATTRCRVRSGTGTPMVRSTSRANFGSQQLSSAHLRTAGSSGPYSSHLRRRTRAQRLRDGGDQRAVDHLGAESEPRLLSGLDVATTHPAVYSLDSTGSIRPRDGRAPGSPSRTIVRDYPI